MAQILDLWLKEVANLHGGAKGNNREKLHGVTNRLSGHRRGASYSCISLFSYTSILKLRVSRSTNPSSFKLVYLGPGNINSSSAEDLMTRITQTYVAEESFYGHAIRRIVRTT